MPCSSSITEITNSLEYCVQQWNEWWGEGKNNL